MWQRHLVNVGSRMTDILQGLRAYHIVVNDLRSVEINIIDAEYRQGIREYCHSS